MKQDFKSLSEARLLSCKKGIFFAALLITASACSERTPGYSESEEIRTASGGRGLVLEIIADGNMAVIKHDEIPGFMMAMTMTFGLREDSIRSAISNGDSIAFEVSYDGIDSWISRVVVLD